MSEPRHTMSLAAKAMPTIMRLKRANQHYRSREYVRAHMRDLTVRPRPQQPPKRLRKNVTVTAEYDRGWRIHTISPSNRPTRGTVVYLHGGGWIHEAATAHWKLVQRIADEASVSVVMPAYPLAHEGGTAETVTPRIAEICEKASGTVTLMGDSAGGGIALSASLMLGQRTNPAALTALISPALDLRFGNPEIDAVQPQDPWLMKKGQLEISEMWIGDHGEDPILNPFLGDTTTLGRLLIFSGTRDILHPDARLFARYATEAGADIEYHEQPGHIHVYPLLPTPEGERARREIIEAVVRTVG